MPRYIDADALAKTLNGVLDEEPSLSKMLLVRFAEQILNETPTVDVVPVRHGHWTNIKISVTGNSSAECSLCGTVVHDTFADVDRLNYCPNCGAKMDEVGEDA